MSGLAFSSEAAEKLIAAYRAPELIRQREATLQRLSLKPGERVVDIGCGPGFLCESMAAAVGPAGCVVGIDISDDLIRFAAGNKTGNTIDYRIGDATALPVDTAQFDLAVSTQVLEYVANADTALGEMFRVLRPGGRAFIFDTDFDSWVWHAADRQRMARIMRAWDQHCADSRLPRTLIPRLRAAGFTIVSVEGYPLINTTWQRGDFSHGLSRLIADFLRKRGFDSAELDAWQAELVETERRNASFFSLNRYFFSVTKP
jgi:arsenite methyltransferase